MWLDAKYLNPFFTRRLTQEVRVRETAGVGTRSCSPVILVLLSVLLQYNNHSVNAKQASHAALHSIVKLFILLTFCSCADEKPQ